MKKWLILVWAFLLIATLGGAAYVLVEFREYVGKLPDMREHISLFGWSLLVVATAIYYLLDYVRLLFLLGLVDESISFWKGIQVVFITEFAGVLTPTAELHFPASIFALTQFGVPAGKATATATMKTAFGTVWVGIMALLMLFAYDDVKLPSIVSKSIPYVVVPIAGITAAYLAVIVFSKRLAQWSERMQQKRRSRWMQFVFNWIGRTARAFDNTEKATPSMHVWAHATNLARILCYCGMGYLLAKSVGYEMPIMRAITIFSCSMMIDYFAPVPGSIGVTEFATAYMIDPQLHPAAIFAVIVLRICCKYLILIPGAIVAIRLFHKNGLALFLKSEREPALRHQH